MSILDRMLNEATRLGINTHETIDEQGMAYVLAKAENYGLLTFKPGMAPDWVDASLLYAHEHNRKPFTFGEMVAAVLQMSVDADRGFQLPRNFFTAVSDYTRRNIRKALNGRNSVPIPHELQGTTVDEEREYTRHWLHHAARTGDGAESEALALDAIGVARHLEPAKTVDVDWGKLLADTMTETIR